MAAVVALRHVLEELHMLGDVRAQIQRYERRQLQITGVDKTPGARVARRHLLHIQAHQGQRHAVRNLGDGVLLDADVDGSGEQRQRARPMRMLVLRHQRGGTQRRHGGLAQTDQMHVRPQRLEKLDQVLHILVKAETPFRHGHQPGIDPVRDVDIEIRQELAQRVLRQRGVVTGHRGDKDNLRRCGGAGMMEATQLAKRLRNHDLFDDGRGLAADGERLIVEGLLRILPYRGARPTRHSRPGSDSANSHEADGEGA